ncbi:MAG: SPOR domain-containing protein [Rhodothalassiaceae bacterium]
MQRILLLIAILLAGFGAAAQTTAPTASPLEEGRRLYFAGDYAGAAALWRPLAEAGDPRALYNMATLYRRGLGVEKDPATADRLLRAAADKGFPEAQYLLAGGLFDTEGASEAERQEAVGYWLAAAAQGHALSQYRLALLYWNGEAVARDLVRGRAWMALAARQGLAEAGAALATMDRYLDAAQKAAAVRLAAQLAARDVDERPAAAAVAAPPRQDRARRPSAKTTPQGSQPEPARSAVTPQPAAAAGAVKPAEAAPAAAPAVDLADAWKLQLAAFRSERAAQALWQQLAAQAPDLVSGLEHRILIADRGEKGVFYRLLIGPFASRAEAERRCHALEAAGQACFPVAPSG